ncbi:MAG: response regulator [bacterium]|nr:response regulator [bacterium]
MPRRLRVLIVDDEVEIVRLLSEIISTVGWEAVGARDGLDAYELFKREKFDLIITDIYMPRMNGLELLAKVKKDKVEMPVMLITGYSHFKQLLQSLRYKPDGFLQKPFDVSELILSIGNIQMDDQEMEAEQ